MNELGHRYGVELSPPTFGSWRGTGGEKDVALLMSGGVDSSAAALLLKQQGWNVVGVTMKVPVASGYAPQRLSCGAEAASVCNALGIPHYFLDVSAAFRTRVIEPFEAAYIEGRTPNPCVDCNAQVKFGVVWDFLEQTLGVRRLATGHYARMLKNGGHPRLAAAVDVSRDQSYFLYAIPRRRLADLVLPLGDMPKASVRAFAHDAALPAADRHDSMELCFAQEGDYRQALSGRVEARKGPILDMAGNVLGEHEGIFNYTVGQRRGLGVAAGEPLYVIRIWPDRNAIVLGAREDALHKDVSAGNLHVLFPERFRVGQRLLGKIRSYGDGAACRIVEASDTSMRVAFDRPQFAPCPGQRLVLYDEHNFVVAGGIIADGP